MYNRLTDASEIYYVNGRILCVCPEKHSELNVGEYKHLGLGNQVFYCNFSEHYYLRESVYIDNLHPSLNVWNCVDLDSIYPDDPRVPEELFTLTSLMQNKTNMIIGVIKQDLNTEVADKNTFIKDVLINPTEEHAQKYLNSYLFVTSLFRGIPEVFHVRKPIDDKDLRLIAALRSDVTNLPDEVKLIANIAGWI